jgi:Transposase IS116/IS110/IS902 family
LAQLLRADLLPEAWIAPAQVRQLRALLRHRASLVRLGTSLRNRIHAVAADHGYDRSASYWTGPGRGWLAELDLPPASREIVTDCLAVIDGLAPVIDRLDGELHQHAKADPRVKVLRTLPGVGEFTALMMLAEIGDISRFGSARKLASWAGLTPTVRGSDLKVRHGHISKQGSAWLRWVLNQAAQTAKRSPQFATSYQTIAKRRGKKIATIAIARKLLTRAYHLLAGVHATDTTTPHAAPPGPAWPPASASCPGVRPARRARARSSSAATAAWVVACPAPRWTAAWRSSAKSASAGPQVPRSALAPAPSSARASASSPRSEATSAASTSYDRRTLISGHSRTLPAKIH